ncbi:hypothetical protein P0F65_22115 [Sphingomonas sp. I4]
MKLPSPATCAVPITVPTASRMVTVAPASPVPVTLVPSPATWPVGASGAVRSGAVSAAPGETLPVASACTTVRAWLLTWGVPRTTA